MTTSTKVQSSAADLRAARKINERLPVANVLDEGLIKTLGVSEAALQFELELAEIISREMESERSQLPDLISRMTQTGLSLSKQVKEMAEERREMREALEDANTYLLGLAAYLATCATDTIIENLETTIAVAHKQAAKVDASHCSRQGEAGMNEETYISMDMVRDLMQGWLTSIAHDPKLSENQDLLNFCNCFMGDLEVNAKSYAEVEHQAAHAKGKP